MGMDRRGSAMNKNAIITGTWSNDESKRLYELHWPDEPVVKQQYEEGQQCGGCAFFAPFNFDWGLCCHSQSRHFSETVFEHFTCPSVVNEGWDAHSVSTCNIDDIFDDPNSGGGTEKAEN